MVELEDKYSHEIEQERMKFELLREEKCDMEMEYEENIKNLEELHAKQTQDLEASFQHKMMVEVSRYQKKAAERDKEHREWEEQHRQMLERHQRQVTGQVDECRAFVVQSMDKIMDMLEQRLNAENNPKASALGAA